MIPVARLRRVKPHRPPMPSFTLPSFTMPSFTLPSFTLKRGIRGSIRR